MTINPSTEIAIARFADLFDTQLPRGLRELADGMSPQQAAERFGSAGGPVRLGQWECTDSGSARWPGPRTYRATIAIGDRIATTTTTASGPLAALTGMLHQRGIALEILNFHQLRSGAATATFIRGHNGSVEQWAAGWSVDAGESALRALIACANRLSGS